MYNQFTKLKLSNLTTLIKRIEKRPHSCATKSKTCGIEFKTYSCRGVAIKRTYSIIISNMVVSLIKSKYWDVIYQTQKKCDVNMGSTMAIEQIPY